MIKPIQRITKYGLLLSAILDTTAKHDYPHRAELEQGAAAVRRIAAGINEVTDFKAKQATVRELVERVEDWKGHEVEKFGDLYLDEHFTVTKADQPRDYHVFLFEKMMLCCKEVTGDRKKTKSALRKDKGRSAIEKKRLALKGRIFVSNINRATIDDGNLTIAWTVPHRHPNGYSEEVEDWFVMTGRSAETLKKWADKVIELAVNDRKRQAEYRSARHSGRASSQFQSSSWAPPTPATEAPPFQFPPPMPDDEDDGYRSGRTTPSISGMHGPYPVPIPARRVQSQQSMPASQQAELRARAMTEDQNGPSITQWRQAQIPPMPRLMSNASEASFGTGIGSGSRPALGRQTSTASRLGPAEEVDEDAYYHEPGPRGMARAPSQPHTGLPYPPQLRNRSASSPNVYQLPQGAPPLPPSGWTESPINASSSTTLVGGTAYFTKRMSDKDKRFSSESHSTETSETSSGQSPATPYAQSSDLRHPTPVSRQNSSDAQGNGNGLLLRVKCGDCHFSIGVSLDVTYPVLHQKIAKKVRLFKGTEPTSLHIKWVDSDGDEVSLKCDQDVEGMFEDATEMGLACVTLIARAQ